MPVLGTVGDTGVLYITVSKKLFTKRHKIFQLFFFRGKTSVTAHTATTDFYSVKMKDISIV